MDKLKNNWGNYVYVVFLSAVFKDGGETHNAARVGLLMGKRGWYLPLHKLRKK